MFYHFYHTIHGCTSSTWLYLIFLFLVLVLHLIRSLIISRDMYSIIKTGSAFSNRLKQILGMGLVKIVISTNPMPTIYVNRLVNTELCTSLFPRYNWVISIQICHLARTGGKRYWSSEQKSPYMVTGDQWVGYEDATSLKHKVCVWVSS